MCESQDVVEGNVERRQGGEMRERLRRLGRRKRHECRGNEMETQTQTEGRSDG